MAEEESKEPLLSGPAGVWAWVYLGPLTHLSPSVHAPLTTGFTGARFSPAKARRKETAVLLLISGESDHTPSHLFSKPCP